MTRRETIREARGILQQILKTSSPEAVAASLSVSLRTLSRWISGESVPHPIAMKALRMQEPKSKTDD